MDPTALRSFGSRYAEAWSSQNPESVGAFFADGGSLQVNDDAPAVGRAAIAALAQEFMTAFPDTLVLMDDIVARPAGESGEHGGAVFYWTYIGTNTGPGGTGKRVRFSGDEVWTFAPDGLVAESKGHFDAAEYQRQIEHGVDG